MRLQQGRVAVDADWNEAVDIAQGATRTTNADVIGPTGMPAAAPGFEITPVADAGGFDLLIGEGRAYVAGILVEHDAAPTTLTRVSGAGANTVWSVDLGPRLAVGQWLGPADDPKSNLLAVASIEAAQAGDEGRQRIKLHKAFGAGTQSVRAFASLRVQPQLPQAAVPEAAGPYLAYLDVWERAITALEDPLIAEVALGGVDTAVRTQVVWQVKLLALQPLIDAGRLTAPPMCKSFPAGWSPDDATDRVQLKARARAEAATTNPCELPARGGYRSLENQLYRVEVHSGGVVGTDKVRIKWSRDNGVHRSRLLDVVEGSLLVEEIGKDDATAFGTDDWLEVLDEGRILRGEPGFFVEIGEVVGTRLGIRQILDPVTLAPLVQNDAPNADALPKRGLVRRWEGGAPVEVTPAQPMALERGIEIEIPSGRAHVGDYWLIPARGLTAGIEWPADPASGGPASLPPRGVVHAYCPLALLTKADPGGWTLVDDCRPIFSPLTRLDSFFYLGGDGQETRPDLTAQGGAAFTALEQPLRVGVARGRAPIKGRPVRFSVVDQSNPGRLTPAAGTNAGDVIASTPQRLILRTNAEGVAAAAFTIPNSRHANHVTAELLDASDPPQASRVHLPITFTATTSIAGEVAYDPGRLRLSEYGRGRARGRQDRAGGDRQAMPAHRLRAPRRWRPVAVRQPAGARAAQGGAVLGQAAAQGRQGRVQGRVRRCQGESRTRQPPMTTESRPPRSSRAAIRSSTAAWCGSPPAPRGLQFQPLRSGSNSSPASSTRPACLPDPRSARTCAIRPKPTPSPVCSISCASGQGRSGICRSSRASSGDTMTCCRSRDFVATVSP